MGNYFSTEEYLNGDAPVFHDNFTGYANWVRFEYNKARIANFNKPRTLRGR